MLNLISGQVKWRADQELFRQFFESHGFEPNVTPEEISRDYCARSRSERAVVEGAWYDLMKVFWRDAETSIPYE